MTEIRFTEGPIQESDQDILSNGLELHGKQNNAPEYKKTRLNWMVYRDEQLVGALTADLLWDWIYISELWVDDSCRGTGLGKQLMAKVEEHAREQGVTVYGFGHKVGKRQSSINLSVLKNSLVLKAFQRDTAVSG
ncbi:histone acetyltransferase HPA2 [Vibrio ishigakensis]|uniref:Histone acetyltransferase HPA2 n=1 Tax=Vibrio ishigakensis TaxID=1481914 RepID=A0A0B8Q6A2_9VIBR|nr:histone acetyltransferase HPA2 [Vibrio ishigakensis]